MIIGSLTGRNQVVDHGGTPTDPSDDQFLEFHGVVKFVGHSEDYCTAIVQAIG